MSAVIGLVSYVYGKVAGTKNFLYDSGLADSVRVSPSVISIGNLTVGGTGKTPVTDLLLKETNLRGLKTAVVSRNYKAKSRIAQQVVVDDVRGASYFGDEAFLLAQRNQDTLVYTGPQKWQTTLKLMKDHHPQVIFVDDGFQHRALARDFDIVLLDATAPLSDYELLPKGKARETINSLKRAQLVVITKVNWATPEKVSELKAMIPGNVEMVEMEFHMILSEPIDGLQRVLAISGVASPKNFINGLKDQGDFEVSEHLVFPDHHDYGVGDIQKITAAAQNFSCTKIVTTEKDFVKLSKYRDELATAGLDLITVGLNVQWRTLPKGLNEYLDKIAQF